jgi:threonine aldolase
VLSVVDATLVIFFDGKVHRNAAPFARKQGMQLASKMRFIASQFLALLENDRWLTYAAHANAMTKRLEERTRRIGGVRITRPVHCNAIFATFDRKAIQSIQQRCYFYVFDEALPEVRWMTHHATTEADVDAFANLIAMSVAGPTC